MRTRWLTAIVVVLPTLARGACPPSCPLPGGGSPKHDCHAEFATGVLRLNYPPFDPARPRPGTEVRCFDGDAGCDTDGAVNGECRFDVNVCLLRSADPALPRCTPAEVTSVSVVNPGGDPDLQSLASALGGLLPSTADACTTGQTLRVPLVIDGSGHLGRASKIVRLKARTGSAVDVDRLRLTCVPREWPSHGYDHANHRATPLETTLAPANAAQLAVKWQLDLTALAGAGNNGVTSTPTVGAGSVFVTSWNGNVYAVDVETGRVRWKYDTGSGGILGVQSSATLTADGRLLVGDSAAVLHCLRARTGQLLWKTSLGDPSVDHIWASPAVANGRVIIGVASHSDQPCTQGKLFGVDLDTGAMLWPGPLKTVPDGNVCVNDPTIACSVDTDCPSGTCQKARGAGITATVAIDATGETVYMNTVGCYTFPSIGDSDSIFRVQAGTGAVDWKVRVQPPEHGPKAFYHDFGFLNGPILADADDGMGGTRLLVVSGSKDGSLYARLPADGTEAWTRAVRPAPNPPGFAGFGLFNGAIGFADQRFHAALNDFIPASPTPPKHLMAFSPVDGSTLWEDEIGDSWGSMAIANGLLFVGTLDASEYYVYDAAAGVRLKTFTMPTNVSSGASIVDGTVYVGYGIFGDPGGVMAFALP